MGRPPFPSTHRPLSLVTQIMDVVVHVDALPSDATAGGCVPVDADALAAALDGLPAGVERR